MNGNKKILLINPNSLDESTKRIEGHLKKIVSQEYQIIAVTLKKGPRGVQSFYDLNLSTFLVQKLIQEIHFEFDGVLIAGFSDPGLDVLKEILEVPVVGIGEAAYHAACMLGHKFSVITILGTWTSAKERYVKSLGLESRLASMYSIEMTYPEIERDIENAKRVTIETARRAVSNDGAEVIILGGSAFIGMAESISKELKVPVIDPSTLGLKFLESFIALGLKQSKKGLFAGRSAHTSI